MKIKELRELLANAPDDYEFGYRDPNFGGLWPHHPLDARQVDISDKDKTVLIDVPYWNGFTGVNLEQVEFGLRCAESEVHNQIVTCPDPQEYAAELEHYVAQRAHIQRLLKMIRSRQAKQQKT